MHSNSGRHDVVDVVGYGQDMGAGNGDMDRAGWGAQFPVPWDLFGLLGIPNDHRHKSHHHRSHRSM